MADLYKNLRILGGIPNHILITNENKIAAASAITEADLEQLMLENNNIIKLDENFARDIDLTYDKELIAKLQNILNEYAQKVMQNKIFEKRIFIPSSLSKTYVEAHLASLEHSPDLRPGEEIGIVYIIPQKVNIEGKQQPDSTVNIGITGTLEGLIFTVSMSSNQSEVQITKSRYGIIDGIPLSHSKSYNFLTPDLYEDDETNMFIPSYKSDPANKKYVDDEVKKLNDRITIIENNVTDATTRLSNING